MGRMLFLSRHRAVPSLEGGPVTTAGFAATQKTAPPKNKTPRWCKNPRGMFTPPGDVHAISSRKFSVMGEAAGEDQATVSKQG